MFYLLVLFENLLANKLAYEKSISNFSWIVNSFVKLFYTSLLFFAIRKRGNTDMTTFERIQELAKKRDKNLKEISIELGYSKNYLYTLKTKEPAADKLRNIANYFNVSVDYLLGRTDNPNSDNLEEDEITTFFRVNTEDLTESEKDQLREELKEYLEFMKSRLKNK